MDSDRATPENFDQVTSDDQGASQGRYYDCTFCKRGFSNAQALGGHMNIHRKEKAQLKRFVNGTQRVDETPLHSPIPRNSSWPSETKPRDKRSTVEWPWVSTSQQGDATTRDGIHVGEFQEFPLFFETQSDENQKPGSQLRGEPEKAGSSSTHVSSGSVIDLELRLGSGA